MKKASPRPRAKKRGLSVQDYREIASSFPAVEEGTSYGTLAFRVRGKFFTRLREDGESVVVKPVMFEERDALIRQSPDVYYFTDHYRDYPCLLVRLPAATTEDLRMLLEQAWLRLAPKRLVEDYEADRGS